MLGIHQDDCRVVWFRRLLLPSKTFSKGAEGDMYKPWFTGSFNRENSARNKTCPVAPTICIGDGRKYGRAYGRAQLRVIDALIRETAASSSRSPYLPPSCSQSCSPSSSLSPRQAFPETMPIHLTVPTPNGSQQSLTPPFATRGSSARAFVRVAPKLAPRTKPQWIMWKKFGYQV
ncbi:hypothetical protein BC628DRAFT_728456 [Trametes gibbosa]|nr:hypothetical protein BC628DRAFT_728456 [Trametes gibbosa]